MPAEIKKEIQLEIAHVLFIDIVGYSKFSIDAQHAAVDELTQIVRSTEQFQKADAADRLIKIATGDGMALVFFTLRKRLWNAHWRSAALPRPMPIWNCEWVCTAGPSVAWST